ncbi:MAG TPA: hypothetical protein VE842_00530 [Pyrinomonadaceae bacterium]|nr:hypothetical protein [Pyrinomonadaceae bacterium]
MSGSHLRLRPVPVSCTAFVVLLLISGAVQAQNVKPGSGITGHYSTRSPSAENSLDALLLPDGKVKIYLYASWIGSVATGNVNTGEIRAILPLVNRRTALYESGQCRITIRFAGNKAIVRQSVPIGDCGFGLNVSADGTYKKRNSRRPKFNF